MTEPIITQSYRARFLDVLRYIEEHLDSDVSVERLSEVAHFSKFHFHRQFAALFGIGVYRYVQLTRLKRAAHQLAFRPDCSILEIALATGYEGPEAFARAFKRTTGQSPSLFRTQPDWLSWQTRYQPLRDLKMSTMKEGFQLDDVQIVDFAETRVAVLEHRGDPRLLGDSIRRFIEWRKQNRLSPAASATFNLLYDDPAETSPEAFRLDFCAATPGDVPKNAFGVIGKVIPAGRCAALRHTGSDDTLGKSARWLYSQWLPQSAESVRDFPLFVQRVRFFPDVPEHEATTDIFLPLR